MSESPDPSSAAGNLPGEVRPTLSQDELEFLAGMFDLARRGDPLLVSHVDRGLPVNLTNDQGDTLLVLAAYYRHADLVAALLERGADTERQNDRGQTALGCAVFRRDEAITRLLLGAGADPHGGSHSARSIADFFVLPEMAAILDEA